MTKTYVPKGGFCLLCLLDGVLISSVSCLPWNPRSHIPITLEYPLTTKLFFTGNCSAVTGKLPTFSYSFLFAQSKVRMPLLAVFPSALECPLVLKTRFSRVGKGLQLDGGGKETSVFGAEMLKMHR